MSRLICVLVAAALPAAVSAASIAIDFDALADLEPVSTQFAGITFLNATALTAGFSVNEFEFPPRSGANVAFDDGGAIVVTFGVPVLLARGYVTYAEAVTLEAFDAANVLQSSAVSAFPSNLGLSGFPGSAPNELLEVSFAGGIQWLRFSGNAGGGSLVLDDFSYETAANPVPEPGTLWLGFIAALIALRRRRSRIALMALAAQAVWAAPVVRTPGLNPPVFTVGVATAITVVSEIPENTPIAGGVNLIRVPAAGAATVLGVMRDDGTNGDAIANDKRYSLRLTMTEPAAGSVRLRVSAAFPGVLLRVTAESVLQVGAVPSPLLSGGSGDLVEQSIPDLAFPPASDTEFVYSDSLKTSISNRGLLLDFRPGVTVGPANQLLMSIGGRVVGGDPDLGSVLVQLVVARSAQAMVDLAVYLNSHTLVTHAALDFRLQPARIPGPSESPEYAWGEVGTWPLVAIRAPSAWNILDDASRNTVPRRVLVYDQGFSFHPDLAGKVNPAPPVLFPSFLPDHGTMVAGIIAANYHNYAFIDGIAPNALIDALVYPTDSHRTIKVLKDFLKNNPEVNIVNISFGWEDSLQRVASGVGDNEAAQQQLDGEGDRAKRMMEFFSKRGKELLIVAAAGNATLDGDLWPVPSRWASPWCNASARIATENPIVCVESVQAGGNGYPRAPTSGACPPENPVDVLETRCLAAPGGAVFTLSYQTTTFDGGTSFAAPMVAAAAAFLKDYFAMSVQRVYQHLKRYSRAPEVVNGQLVPRARMLDLYAALLGHDLELPKPVVQPRIIDVDDGTPDGNTRTDRSDLDDDGNTTEIYPTQVTGAHGIETTDHRRGDGNIDMADFRPFRDAMLQANVANGLGSFELDGGALHFKRDINFDGCVENNVPDPLHPFVPGLSQILPDNLARCSSLFRSVEQFHARYDFNGDGKLNGFQVAPPANAVAPFQIQAATTCTGLNTPAGCLRDIDIMADARPGLWTGHTSLEHVKVSPPGDLKAVDDPCSAANSGWRPTLDLMDDRNGNGIIDYFQSADLHFILGPNPGPGGSSPFVVIRILTVKPGTTEYELHRCMWLEGAFGKTKFVVTVPLLTSNNIIVSLSAPGLPAPFAFQTIPLPVLTSGRDITLVWPGGATPLVAIP